MRKTYKKNIFDQKHSKLKIALVLSNYYPEVVKGMEDSCIDYLVKSGVKKENINVFYAPGSWELPIIAKHAVKTKKYDAIGAFGVIVKGDTYHFDLVSSECARGLMDIALEFETPVINEVLAVCDIKDAKKRAFGENSKGIEAAIAILESILSLKKVNDSVRK
ncbi:MAG: 6,7-dimethyl-8-ribityllumazine synthase [Candidatus Levyibacteriota bacterium]